MKLVINQCHGGFHLSPEVTAILACKGYDKEKKCWMDDRSNPDLVSVVETLGLMANGKYSHLKVVEIPDDVQYTIDEYDGMEWVTEDHRTWA